MVTYDLTNISNQAVKKRDDSLDAVCGLLIIHIINDVYIVWSNRVLFFFMAWFYFKSGMFHKKQSLSESVKNGYVKYLKPYIFYSLVGELFRFFYIYRYGDTNIIHYTLSPIKAILIEGAVYGNLALWFLLSIFVVKVVVSFFDYCNIPKTLALFISFIVLYLLEDGGRQTLIIPCIIKNVPMGIFFYLCGNILTKIQFCKLSIIISTFVSFYALFVSPSNMDFRTGNIIQGVWIVYILSSLASIIVINNLFVIRFMQIDCLVNIGKNSLSYYCFHWIMFEIVFMICNFIMPYDIGNPNYVALWTLIICSVIILPVYSYFADYIRRNIPVLRQVV